MRYDIQNQDCIEWMDSQVEQSIDCIITSPPYNLDISYGKYKDDLPRESYLKWMGDVASSMKRVLSDVGHLFLNVGYTNNDPWVAMDVAQVFRQHFVLQNNFTWVKHILVNDRAHGIFKPITSNRYVSPTTESIFHFTKTGDVSVDRLSIGHRNKAEDHTYPELYSEGRYIATARRKISKRLGYANWKDIKKNGTQEELENFESMLSSYMEKNPFDPEKKKCIGNAWYIPYTPTAKLAKEMGERSDSGSREKSRGGHPATFPEGLSTQCILFSGIPSGSVVYDPFVGTGTTVVSAVKLGMVGIGTDIDENYLDFAKRRLNNLTPSLFGENDDK